MPDRKSSERGSSARCRERRRAAALLGDLSPLPPNHPRRWLDRTGWWTTTGRQPLPAVAPALPSPLAHRVESTLVWLSASCAQTPCGCPPRRTRPNRRRWIGLAPHRSILGLHQSVVVAVTRPRLGEFRPQFLQQSGHRVGDGLRAIMRVKPKDGKWESLQHRLRRRPAQPPVRLIEPSPPVCKWRPIKRLTCGALKPVIFASNGRLLLRDHSALEKTARLEPRLVAGVCCWVDHPAHRPVVRSGPAGPRPTQRSPGPCQNPLGR